MAILYHIGLMHRIVYWMAFFMKKTLKTSGAESLSAAANIFVGQTEAPLLIRPYLEKMTRSEILAVMIGGMANLAGGVLAAYVSMLSDTFPDIAGHLIAGSIMSAPASLVLAKILLP
jgi:CNT family concentrative nucleoside transporter